MSTTADRSREQDRRAWRAWDARIAEEARRLAAELRASTEKPRPVKGVRRQCPA